MSVTSYDFLEVQDIISARVGTHATNTTTQSCAQYASPLYCKCHWAKWLHITDGTTEITIMNNPLLHHQTWVVQHRARLADYLLIIFCFGFYLLRIQSLAMWCTAPSALPIAHMVLYVPLSGIVFSHRSNTASEEYLHNTVLKHFLQLYGCHITGLHNMGLIWQCVWVLYT